MSRLRGLHWGSTRDLYILGNETEKSVNSSMINFNSDCTTTCLKMRPTYITEEVLQTAKEILQTQGSQDPMIIVDIETNKVVIEFVTLSGPNMEDVNSVARWELVESYKYQYSGEMFFGFIAYECYEMVRHFSRCFGSDGPRNVFCSMVFRFQGDQSSIKDSKVTKFCKDFDVADCIDKDIVQMFNYRLLVLSYYNPFKIICTHMMDGTIHTFAGLSSQQNVDQPDILVINELGVNICFFENLPGTDGQLQKMIINSEISDFGTAIGSAEYNTLVRFISKQDFEINDAQMNLGNLCGFFTRGYRMCQIVLTYLRKKIPDFLTKYDWLSFPNAVGIEDISDLLESANLKSDPSCSLKAVYENLDDETRKDLIKLCEEIRDRSASMMAGFVFGIMKRVAQKSNKNKLVVGLTGEVMLEMFGYKDQFESALKKLQDWHTNKNGPECSIEAKLIDSSSLTLEYGVVSIAKYIEKNYYAFNQIQ